MKKLMLHFIESKIGWVNRLPKTVFLLIGFFICGLHAKANHIAGGELSYSYVGLVNGMHQYTVTLKLYRSCDADRDFDNAVIISIFNKASNTRVGDNQAPLNRRQTASLTDPNPCITNPPVVCLEVAYYTTTILLPATETGYTLSTQVNFRADGMNNLTQGYDNVGATYTAEVPGTTVATWPVNSSALFVGSDLEVLCSGNRFSYSFAATDADGDALRYSLCDAFRTQGGMGGNVSAAAAPPYTSVPYGSGYNGSAPLGSGVQINETTGLITGTAPQTGTYVIAVCVSEVRNGVVIATQRKDIQVRTSSCTVAAADLFPTYMLCKDTKEISISNRSSSSLINSFQWSLFNRKGEAIFSTSDVTFEYSFKDTGTYTVKLVVGTINGCADSTTSQILVYPGFYTGFTVGGSCFQSPFQFTDTGSTQYGTIAFRLWDFGDAASLTDVATDANPKYQYPAPGTYNVSLITAGTSGCRDTVLKTVSVTDKPALNLAFRDTVLCRNDSVQLQVVVAGNVEWLPAQSISNSHSAAPFVYPSVTTLYRVALTEGSCVAQDSVLVRVVDFITVQLPEDTTVCSGDTFQLTPISNGGQFSWLPQTGLNDAAVKAPLATVQTTTTYTVMARLGRCQASDFITVIAAPYPTLHAGSDTVLCFGSSTQLQGTTNATSFSWSPAAGLSNPTTLQPLATPTETTAYVLSATANSGCPKPARDTVLVTVLPQIIAFAGRDTAIVAGQPVQLQARGGDRYTWFPATGLSNATIPNPVATLDGTLDSVAYVVTVQNAACSATDRVVITVFKTGADIFVPTAFTPNGDGRNDIMLPTLVGISRFDYFRIYNRWGKLVYNTNQSGRGWDGRLSGVLQRTETFVFMAQGLDYTGRKIFKKGTFTLIR